MNIGNVGYWSGLSAFTATIVFCLVQVLQLSGALQFPADEILIYGSSLCIVIPFILEMLAFHYLTPLRKQFWTHAALVFVFIYAVFVIANYATQLGTVIPAKLNGTYQDVRLLDQTPHSMFWNFDAVGYVAMGLACLLAVPALNKSGFDQWVRRALLAHAMVTPLICLVYFYPIFSSKLLVLGAPWAITAPLAMLMLAIMLRGRQSPNELTA